MHPYFRLTSSSRRRRRRRRRAIRYRRGSIFCFSSYMERTADDVIKPARRRVLIHTLSGITWSRAFSIKLSTIRLAICMPRPGGLSGERYKCTSGSSGEIYEQAERDRNARFHDYYARRLATQKRRFYEKSLSREIASGWRGGEGGRENFHSRRNVSPRDPRRRTETASLLFPNESARTNQVCQR